MLARPARSLPLQRLSVQLAQDVEQRAERVLVEQADQFRLARDIRTVLP